MNVILILFILFSTLSILLTIVFNVIIANRKNTITVDFLNSLFLEALNQPKSERFNCIVCVENPRKNFHFTDLKQAQFFRDTINDVGGLAGIIAGHNKVERVVGANSYGTFITVTDVK